MVLRGCVVVLGGGGIHRSFSKSSPGGWYLISFGAGRGEPLPTMVTVVTSPVYSRARGGGGVRRKVKMRRKGRGDELQDMKRI